MAICNVFKELTSESGLFLTFSSYMDDLTKWATYSSSYKVIPSKFVVLEIGSMSNGNIDLPKILQNNFENGVAVSKNNSKYSYSTVKSLFWGSLIDNNILSISQNSIPNIKYVGDINIQSYDEVDGMGYSEIYCYIPDDEGQYSYTYEESGVGDVLYSKDVIEGFEKDDLDGWVNIGDELMYDCGRIYNFSWESNSNLISSKVDNDSYTANAIIILYDIYNKNERIEDGLPLGIYLPGIFDVYGDIQNKIYKYTHNQDIYDGGTSYGLRICSRFVASSGALDIQSIKINSDYHSELSKVLSKISETHDLISEILNNTYTNSQNYKELYSIFKNSRTNVPYLKNIKGKNYWFVNGRMIGDASYESGDNEHTCYDLQLSIDNNIILLTENESIFHRDIKWVLKSGDVELSPSKLYVNGVNIDIKNPINLVVDKPNNQTLYNYDITADINNIQVTESTWVQFVWPSYFGLVVDKNNINPQTMQMLTLGGKEMCKTYDNDSLMHVCFMYPKQFGLLKSIRDSRDIEYINDFTVEEKTVTYNGTAVDYYVYIDDNPANVVNYTLKFK